MEYERIELTVYVEHDPETKQPGIHSRRARMLVLEALEDVGPQVKFIHFQNQVSVEIKGEQFAQMLAEDSTHLVNQEGEG